ncbi:MAG TPA: Gfo/Idh/MocA family oxidoreductase [Phototrophicaceae bacterium]|nr:Gfo/Idh/MocA family oxidoreductase [Phototrophicaceae bacterium]
MLRIAMLSFAHVHANDYARQVQAHPEAAIQCIWDDDERRGREGAATYNVPYESDLEKVLSSSDVDAVLINAPTTQHTELLLAAAQHKKHIFTEKALTVSLADADAVVKAVHDAGIQFVISLPSRTRPETLFLKHVLDQGWLGKVTMMRARVAHSAALDHWFHDGSAWFGDASLAGGGALFDLGCHTVDVMRWFLGEPVSVMAKAQNFSNAYPIDDNTVALVEFKSGAIGILDVSWVHRAGPNPLEIYGTEGYVGRSIAPGTETLLNSSKLNALNGERSPYILPTELPKALPMPFQQFVAACLHGTRPTISVEDGRNLTELLEGIYLSANSGREHKFSAEGVAQP